MSRRFNLPFSYSAVNHLVVVSLSSPTQHTASAAAAAPAPTKHHHNSSGAAGGNGGLSEAEALAKAMAESLKLAATQQKTNPLKSPQKPPSTTSSPSPPPSSAAAPEGPSAEQAARFTDFAHVEAALSPIRGVFDDVHNPEVSIEAALARIPIDLKAELYAAKLWARKQGKAAIEAIAGMNGEYGIAIWLWVLP